MQELIDFWFGAPPTAVPDRSRNRLWFMPTADQDAEIASRFGSLAELAQQGELDGWCQTAAGSLALILLLDQFSRSIWRGNARAFAGDERAFGVAQLGVAASQDQQLLPIQRVFFYLPFEHHEDIIAQDRCVELLENLVEEVSGGEQDYLHSSLDHAREHRDIIRRFGRYPHRNTVLGRESTAAERDYLAAGAKTFGQ